VTDPSLRLTRSAAAGARRIAKTVAVQFFQITSRSFNWCEGLQDCRGREVNNLLDLDVVLSGNRC
jgi:hypothetical protein